MGTARPHILILRLGAIGDVINSLVVLRLLRKRWPEAWIGWVVHPLSAPILEGHVDLDELFVLPEKNLLSELRIMRRRWRRIGIDCCVDLSRILKSGLISLVTGAKRRVGFDRYRSKEGNWLFATECTPPGDPQEHVVYQYLDMARQLGALDENLTEEEQVSWGIEVRDEAAARVDGWFSEGGIEGRSPVILNLGASKPANRWSEKKWADLARRLSAAGELVLLCGGPGDRAIAQKVGEALGGSNAPFEGKPRKLAAGIHDWVGLTALVDLVALLHRSRLFISCDTGPMHLAVACGCPVVALFGPANPRRTGPWGNGRYVVSLGLQCGPCRKKRCRRGVNECMTALSVDRVWKMVNLRIDTSRSSA